MASRVNDFVTFYQHIDVNRKWYKVKTFTCCEVAATDEYIMFTVSVPVATACVVRVIWICVYPALIVIVKPVDSDTARVRFTRLLTFCQCENT